MAEDLKGIIEKIQEEGVKEAEKMARSIELEAKERAAGMIESARREVEAMISSAKDEIARDEASVRATLKQAGRDLLLSLRKEVSSMLDRIITRHVHKALNPDEMGNVIISMIKEHGRAVREGIVITVNKDDIEKLDKALSAELGHKAREGIMLKPSDELHGGFVISYDAGKSHFDFSDKALADYIAGYLRPRLAEVLKD